MVLLLLGAGCGGETATSPPASSASGTTTPAPDEPAQPQLKAEDAARLEAWLVHSADITLVNPIAAAFLHLAGGDFTFPPAKDGEQVATCSLATSLEPSGQLSTVFSGEFRPWDQAAQPRLSFTDDGQGTVIGGVAINDKEWELTQSGHADFTFNRAAAYKLHKDGTGTWQAEVATLDDSDAIAFGMWATWVGTATDNFTSETTGMDIEMYCEFASLSLAQALGGEGLDSLLKEGLPYGGLNPGATRE